MDQPLTDSQNAPAVTERDMASVILRAHKLERSLKEAGQEIASLRQSLDNAGKLQAQKAEASFKLQWNHDVLQSKYIQLGTDQCSTEGKLKDEIARSIRLDQEKGCILRQNEELVRERDELRAELENMKSRPEDQDENMAPSEVWNTNSEEEPMYHQMVASFVMLLNGLVDLHLDAEHLSPLTKNLMNYRAVTERIFATHLPLLPPLYDGQEGRVKPCNAHLECLDIYARLASNNLGIGFEAIARLQRAIAAVESCDRFHAGLRKAIIEMAASDHIPSSLMVCLSLWQLVESLMALASWETRDRSRVAINLENRLRTTSPGAADIFRAVTDEEIPAFCTRDGLSEREEGGYPAIIIMPEYDALLVIASRQMRWVGLGQVDLSNPALPVIRVPDGDDVVFKWAKTGIESIVRRERLSRSDMARRVQALE